MDNPHYDFDPLALATKPKLKKAGIKAGSNSFQPTPTTTPFIVWLLIGDVIEDEMVIFEDLRVPVQCYYHKTTETDGKTTNFVSYLLRNINFLKVKFRFLSVHLIIVQSGITKNREQLLTSKIIFK